MTRGLSIRPFPLVAAIKGSSVRVKSTVPFDWSMKYLIGSFILVSIIKFTSQQSLNDHTDFYYTFKARPGPLLTVKPTGRGADFTINTNDTDVAPFTRETKFCSGKLPGNNPMNIQLG